MNDTRIDTAVALLRAKDNIIAGVKAELWEERIRTRHLRHLLADTEERLDQSRAAYAELLIEMVAEQA